MCWGDNTYGQIGDGSFGNRRLPSEVCVLYLGGTCWIPRLIADGVTAGDFHTCAWADSANVICWGWNASGAIGDGTTIDRRTPFDLSVLKVTSFGDADCDRSVSSIDALIVLQFAAGYSVGPFIVPSCHDLADVNVDQEIDALDALLVLQFVSGLLQALPP
jgi:hypothetical protein